MLYDQLNLVECPRCVWNIAESMQNATELSLGSTDPGHIDGLPVKVNVKMAGEKPGKLNVTPLANGKINVAVSYDASPFADMPKPRSFFLDQNELDDYMVKGPQCVLEEKRN